MYQSHNFQDNQKTGGRKFQPKLKISQPGDKYEREADTVADRVMRLSNTETMQMQPEDEEEESIQMMPEEQATVQMKCRECDEDEMLQTKSLNSDGNEIIFRDTEDGTPPVTHTLTNPRFIGNRVLARILSGQISGLSSRHNGRRGAVSIIQQALVDLGFELPMHLVDGNYGAETEEALRQFRNRYGPSAGNRLDGDTLATLDRVAPLPGARQEHTVDYDRLLSDNRLDITVAIGATDTNVLREIGTNRYEDTGRPTEDLMAERFRTWLRGQGFELELMGWSGNEYWKRTRTFIWTNSVGIQESREIDIWINMVVPGEGAASEFRQGLSQDEITIYTGHARYGSGPDFDAKASPLENFRIGIDTALQAAGRRTRVEEARHHGVAIDEEHDLLEMTQSGELDTDRYRVLFFNACTSLAYLDEIREHIGGPANVDVIATRRPSMFSTLESGVGLEETQHFLEGVFTSESVESVLGGLNEIQRQRHGTSASFPRGGVYASSGMGDNPLSP